MRKVKLVADSSSDLFVLEGADFTAAPLKIRTAEREFVDDAKLDVKEMATYLKTYKGKSSTSCPNVGDYLEAFGDADEVYCVTITATLSGSYNAAVLAKRAYEEEHPERKVFVLNSLSTGPEMALILEKIKESVDAGLEFDQVCKTAEDYSKTTGLLFMLESLSNLANNGRVKPVVAKMAGILGIRMVGKASDRGDLEPLAKCRGEKKTLEEIVSQLEKLGFCGGKVYITHCLNEDAASALADMIKAKFRGTQIKIYKTGGLCSFYAELGGMLIGFEKNADFQS